MSPSQQSKEAIVHDIDAYMREHCDQKSRWYVGVSENYERRLFDEHNVPRNGYWIARRAFSSDDAREVENFYHQAGCQGGPGGGDHDAVYVYAFLLAE